MENISLLIKTIQEVINEYLHELEQPSNNHIVFVPVIVGVGNGFTVNIRVAVAVQPAALVTVTVYVPAVVTLIAALVALVFHK